MADMPLDDDPPPVPPLRPSMDDCCRSGCDPCIFDLYDEALERYEAQLRAWQERRGNTAGSPPGRPGKPIAAG